jgi:plastocyanin
MRSLRYAPAALLSVAVLCFAQQVSAQGSPHLIVVKMADATGGRFAFQPSDVIAQRGDTVRFVQVSSAPHDVAFRSRPKGARLGAAATGPYLITPGQTYDLVIDGRFPDGAYEFVCDPHEGGGMKGTLTVRAPIK